MSYGYEPHDQILLPRTAGDGVPGSAVAWRVYPGWRGRVGAGRVVYRVLAQPQDYGLIDLNILYS